MTDGQTEGYECSERAASKSLGEIAFLRETATLMARYLDNIGVHLLDVPVCDSDVEHSLSMLNRIVDDLRRRARCLECPGIVFKPEWHEKFPLQ